MWLIHLTRLALGLSFLATAAYAVAFLLTARGLISLELALRFGLPLMLVPLILIVGTHLLRRSLGALLLRKGLHPEAVSYCQPRTRPSLSVGRNEAAFNLYVAAEATRRMGRPAAALELLDQIPARPWRSDTGQLLKLARAWAMADLGRSQEAAQITAALQEEGLTRAAREPAEALRRQLQAAAS